MSSKPYKNACLPPLEITGSSYLRPHASKTWALLVSERRIKKNNGPASWHFKLWISFHFGNKHKPSYQVVKFLEGDDAE